MLALEDGEVGVEEGAITFEMLLPGHFLLNVIRCVHKVIQDLLRDSVRIVVFTFLDDLLDLGLRREAAPEDELELAKHEQLETKAIFVRTRSWNFLFNFLGNRTNCLKMEAPPAYR